MSTELMLRLIKDGKIVGKRWTLTLGEAKKHLDSDEYEEHQWARCYKDEDMVDIYYVYSEKHPEYTHFTTDQWTLCIFARYDSFDMGIKVGEEWFFEGDRISYGSNDHRINGVLNSPTINHGWVVMKQGVSNELWELVNPKRIGSIYDKKDDK